MGANISSGNKGRVLGYTGATNQPPRLDPSTFSLQTISYPHHEIHGGSHFTVHHYELDFDKDTEIGVLFTTPDSAKWIHVIMLIGVATTALFEILEAPTIDPNNYPLTFYAPRNRNRNSSKPSIVKSVRAVPLANQVSLKVKAGGAPVSADGLVVHAEAFGGVKGKTLMSGMRDSEEYMLKANTTYYFRLKGSNTGNDNVVATMELSWYEHTDKE